MRNAFAPLDDLLIERLFQPASIMIADHTNFGQDRVISACLDIASFAWILSRTGGLSNALDISDAIAATLDVGLLLLGLAALISLRILFRRPKSSQANPLRPAMQAHRAVVLLMLASSVLRNSTDGLANAGDMVMLVFAATGLYLGACVGPPPRRRRRWTGPMSSGRHPLRAIS